MAAASLSYVMGNGDGIAQTLELDAIISQQHSFDADVTQHPVEKGAQPSDHIQPKAEVISLEAVIAEWRVGDPLPPLGVKPSPVRVPAAQKALLRIRDTGTLVTLRGADREVSNLAVSGLRMSFGAKGNNTLRFSCTLTQVRFVETRSAAIQKRTKTPKAKKKKDEGNKPTTPEEPPASLIVSGIDPDAKFIHVESR